MKYGLYFFLAMIPALCAPEHPPATGWEWFKLSGMSLYQGLLAVKALQSQPPPPPGPESTYSE